MEKPQKPIKARPLFYACCFQPLQAIAREMGYNLLMHGSMDRDMDLVAVPWVNDPSQELDLIIAFDKYLKEVSFIKEQAENAYMHSILPGGRSSWVINLNRGGPFNNYTDAQYYLDISITPLVVQA